MQTQNLSKLNSQRHRLDCVMCGYQIDPQNPPQLFTFGCNLRRHMNEPFRVWRCPTCSTVHCLEKVDLAVYYKDYPNVDAELTFPLRMCYRNIKKQLVQHGFSPSHSLLDYGCANGIVIQYLQEQGFKRCHGYDPYGSPDRFGNREILKQAPFDYILLQDVLEHEENPYEMLSYLNGLLAPGGHILIGVPRADAIDLNDPDRSDFYNAIHAPCHLHLYTPEGLEKLGQMQGWEKRLFYDRGYDDTRWFGLNTRAWNAYQRICDGSIDAIFEPIDLKKALRSPEVIFYALFGYLLSYRTSMSMVFHKPGV
jgi:SAM-dependent methyltransferase